MSHTAVAAHIHKALDIHRNFPAEIALDGNCRHLRAEAVCIIFGKIVDLCVPTDSCLVANALRCDPTDPINRRQGDLDVFMSG